MTGFKITRVIEDEAYGDTPMLVDFDQLGTAFDLTPYVTAIDLVAEEIADMTEVSRDALFGDVFSGDFDFSWPLELTTLDPEVLDAYYGFDGGKIDAEGTFASITFDQTATVCGAPEPPAHKRGFRAWITRQNQKEWRAWWAEFDAWIAAGRPDKEVAYRTYIPRAKIVSADDSTT